MLTRRDAIKRIRKLNREIQTSEVWTKKGIESHKKEIMRLQQKYRITDEDI